MNNIHSRVLKLYLTQLDGGTLSPAQRAEMDAHLSACPSCQANAQFYDRQRTQSILRSSAVSTASTVEKVLPDGPRSGRLRYVTLPLRAAFWVGFALLSLVLVQWIFTYLRPKSAVTPSGGLAPEGPPESIPPTASLDDSGKIPVQLLLQGPLIGDGAWSPGGDYFFIPILDIAAPGSDERSISLHFIAADSGKDCQTSETFLGQEGIFESYTWLDNERVLVIDIKGRALLFTRCQPGSQDLSDRFDEPLLRVAQPFDSMNREGIGPLLLEAPSAYWLLDPSTLQVRALADPVPSSAVDLATLQARTLMDPIPTLDLRDSFAWLPSGRQMSVLQPLPGDAQRSRLVVLDLDSGLVLRSMEVEASQEGNAPLVEWLGPERPFVWGFGEGGPLLVDLSVDPPQQVHVLPELLGLDLTYPDQMSSMGVFYTPADGSFHIVAHVNLPEDKSIYLYHGENGQTEKLEGDRQVMMILPGGQRMPLVPMQDTPTDDDGYDLVWVDAPDQPPARLQVSGHTPRNYPTLQSRLLPDEQRMLFGSSQGISLVGLPGGETLAFWQLVGAENSVFTAIRAAPDGRALIAVAYPGASPEVKYQGELLYWIPLDEPGTDSSP